MYTDNNSLSYYVNFVEVPHKRVSVLVLGFEPGTRGHEPSEMPFYPHMVIIVFKVRYTEELKSKRSIN